MQSSQRLLEDIVKDPNANWDDIRKALKARSNGLTNAALVRAISGVDTGSGLGRDASVVPPHVVTTKPSSATSASNVVNVLTMEPRDELGDKKEAEDEVFIFELPLASTEVSADPIRLTRKTSFASAAPSINLMDFGVDNFAELEDEASTCENGLVSRESFVSHYTCDSDGFMGWKKSDDSSADMSKESDSVLSIYCDGEGFLSSHARATNVSEVEKIKHVTDSETEGRITQRNHWNIEDYEVEDKKMFNNSTATLDSTDSKTSMKLLTLFGLSSDSKMSVRSQSNHEKRATFWKKYAPESFTKPSQEGTCTGANELTSFGLSFDSKMSVRSQSNNEKRAPFWKKCAPESLTKPSQESACADANELDKNVRRALLNLQKDNQGVGKIEKPTRRVSISSEKTLQSMLSGLSIEMKPPRSKAKARRRSTFDFSFSNSNEDEMNERQRSDSFNNSFNDQREAIWINRSDGELNIEKECRKLYLDSKRSGV